MLKVREGIANKKLLKMRKKMTNAGKERNGWARLEVEMKINITEKKLKDEREK